jgi:double-strand break repair protein MRE11
MYGLGNLRDERLCRLFSTPNSVEWVRPAPTPDSAIEDWFNIFVLHQNRIAHTQAAKNCVREGHLARFLDLVVWGHEHECIADPWESIEGGGKFSVMQPGSSVATALSEGESKRKHIVLVEIMGQSWRTIKFPLETVRPFAFDSVVLGSNDALDPERPETVSAFLTEKVTAMIEEATRSRGSRTPELPLVRLRVDYTGFSTINTQRFGQKFVGKVANPQDIILWQKQALRRTKAEREAAAATTAAGVAAITNGTLDETRIEDLIAVHLKQNLEVLPEAELTEALRDYVDKGQNNLDDVIKHALLETWNAVEAAEDAAAAAGGRGGGGAGTSTAAATGVDGTEATSLAAEGAADRSEKQLATAIEVAAAKRKTEAIAAAKKRRAEEAARDAALAAAERTAVAARAKARTTTQVGDPTQIPRDAFDASDDDMPAPAPRGRGRGKAASASTKPITSFMAPALNPRKRRAAGTGTAPGSQAPAPRARAGMPRSAATAAKKKLSAYKDDAVGDDRSGDDDIDESMLLDEDEDEEMIEDSDDDRSGGGRGKKKGATAATARGGGRKKQQINDDDELMEEEREMVMASRQGAGRRPAGGGAARTQGLGTADMPITLIDSDEDDDERAEGVSDTTNRGGGRRGGGGGGTQGNGRSQLTFGRLGATASQQVSRWGTLK